MLITINEAVRKNMASGSHWFDPDAMRFFRTKLETDVFDNYTFVTHENSGYGQVGWTVRMFNKDFTKIKTVGELCQYKRRKSAIEAAINEERRFEEIEW